MEKRDLKREFKHLYRPSTKAVVEVVVPPFTYLMIDGKGDPNSSPDYAQAVEVLFSVSYATKFSFRKTGSEIDFSVMPLEGLWWADDWSAFVAGDRAKWNWTMMIMQPSFVPTAAVESAMVAVGKKKSSPALQKLRLEEFSEGRCAQIMHVGPFSAEGPTIEKLHEHILGRGSLAGKHHEVYLSDVRRADPAKWKTVLRQPMR